MSASNYPDIAPSLRIIGVDPGVVTGLFVLYLDHGQISRIARHAIQCSSGVAPEILGSLLANGTDAWPITTVAIEDFVVGRASMRSGEAGSVTRLLVGLLSEITQDAGAAVLTRPAGGVKPWATDERLDAAGLLAQCQGMRHAKDAARHALFAAVRDYGSPDPLSRKARA